MKSLDLLSYPKEIFFCRAHVTKRFGFGTRKQVFASKLLLPDILIGSDDWLFLRPVNFSLQPLKMKVYVFGMVIW